MTCLKINNKILNNLPPLLSNPFDYFDFGSINKMNELFGAPDKIITDLDKWKHLCQQESILINSHNLTTNINKIIFKVERYLYILKLTESDFTDEGALKNHNFTFSAH